MVFASRISCTVRYTLTARVRRCAESRFVCISKFNTIDKMTCDLFTKGKLRSSMPERSWTRDHRQQKQQALDVDSKRMNKCHYLSSFIFRWDRSGAAAAAAAQLARPTLRFWHRSRCGRQKTEKKNNNFTSKINISKRESKNSKMELFYQKTEKAEMSMHKKRRWFACVAAKLRPPALVRSILTRFWHTE